MEIGAGGLRRGDLLPEAEVLAEVGAQEAQGAEVGEVEAQGSEASPRDRHQIHQVGRQFLIHNLSCFLARKSSKRDRNISRSRDR